MLASVSLPSGTNSHVILARRPTMSPWASNPEIRICASVDDARRQFDREGSKDRNFEFVDEDAPFAVDVDLESAAEQGGEVERPRSAGARERSGQLRREFGNVLFVKTGR